MAPQRGEPIAIIGSGCHFPGESSSPSKLWELLHKPRDVLQEIPIERFNPKGVYNADGMYHGSTSVHESYLLTEDHRLFDAQFFKIKPVEAHSIDPQQRMLLETVYESIEASGLKIEELRGSRTAVYVGLMCEEYSGLQLRDLDSLPTYFATATARSIMSNRISYFFDWHGPCMTIDTACSSSLVAVHQAVQTLRSGDSKMAVVAGSNLILGAEPYIAESKLNMLSPGSRSRMWDVDADGYARGDGVAAVVLKTLADALADGDHIECVIRETGVNQDGHTKGITMPSSAAQEMLIRETYTKAGLNPAKVHERCQYFEAHGTGTPAGDPIEAEAICNAFFGSDPGNLHKDGTEKLYVGSVKTVIGHTEGTAGLAGILKASLALQHGVVPPNMLFNALSPAVEPFYGNLKILTAAKSWPALPDGIPRRASVNSFGFGGTNAHAILESYQPKDKVSRTASMSPRVFIPFTFSAASERSLIKHVSQFSAYLKANDSIDLRALAWTLSARRSKFAVRWNFSATTLKDLCAKMETKLEAMKEKSDATTVVPVSSSAKILGIFTGQGAQWASMGRELILASDYVRETIANLEATLAKLPVEDRPSWSLKEELIANSSTSRLNEATLSQPLCTAVQIVLVNLLRGAGIKFDAVVGHSSGEIGAAYAAERISAKDAIRIAYYRGFHAKLASGSDGVKGAMLAVSTSLEDARAFCELPDFEGRISVAASNSSASVTLAGDEYAINEAIFIFEDEGKFSRLLKVDKAYHSHHMISCVAPYMESLRKCDIQAQHPSSNACSWFSSVSGDDMSEHSDILSDGYWKDNMVNPVMFSQSIEKAIEDAGPFEIAFEVGPHPALQGPALQTIQDVSGERIPYSGLLRRGTDDVEAFADALGFAWSHFTEASVDLAGYDKLVSGDASSNLLKDLPSYSWDHDRIYWRESRWSRVTRTRNEPVHELLGTICPDGTEQELRWRNLLKPKEVPWLHGHKLQGQTVFPAAGYVALALEASRFIAGERPIQMIEVQDLVIGRSLTFDDDNSGVETLFTLSTVKCDHETQDELLADFQLYAALSKETATMTSLARGRVQVVLGQASLDLLPSRSPPVPNVVEVDSDRFYLCLSQLGYEYSGAFRGLTSMKRTLDAGTGLVSSPPTDGPRKALLVHPAMLDSAFQSVFLAYCWPGDGRLWSLHVPTRIHRIRVVPSLCLPNKDREMLFPFDSVVSQSGASSISGDVSIYTEDGQSAMLQVEGISVVPFAGAIAAHDTQLFHEVRWYAAEPDGSLMTGNNRATAEDYKLAVLFDRVSYYYLRTLVQSITPGEREAAEWYHKRLLVYCEYCMSQVASGKQPFSDPGWDNDTAEQMLERMNEYADRIEIRLMRAVGENLPAVVRGQTNVLEHMMKDNMLNDFYVESLGIVEYSIFLSQAVLQITQRYPHMKILEIGAGTGGATKTIMKQLGTAFTSYTFTDISTGFFEKAGEVFKGYKDRMIYKALDVEKDIVAQGYVEGSYDMIICSLVLHATRNLESTMKNVRRLLKPGGFLVLLEVTNNKPMRMGLSMGGLIGWWLGEGDGRALSPCIEARQWNSVLRKSGFSGIDAITPETDMMPRPFGVIIAQAVDEGINLLRRPLSPPEPATQLKELVILGGSTLQTSLLADDLERLLSAHCGLITRVENFEDYMQLEIAPMSNVVSLTELDEPTFKSMSGDKLEAVKRFFDQSRNVLWITRGCRAEEPYSNMTVGFGRSLVLEMPHVRLQFLDLDCSDKPDARVLAETLLRLHMTDSWEKEGRQDKVLWSTEPELALEKGRLLVPRIVPCKDRNDRYNSARRTIMKNSAPRDSTISIEVTSSSYVLQEERASMIAGQFDSRNHFIVATQLSILTPLQVGSIGLLPVILGRHAETGMTVFALSETQASLVNVPEHLTVPCRIPAGQEMRLLLLFANELLAQHLLAAVPSGKYLLAHEPEPFLACVLAARAAEKGVKIIYTTTKPVTRGRKWTSVHPKTSKQSIKAILPVDPSLFIDLSIPPSTDGVGARIAACLPPSCEKMNAVTLYGERAVLRPDNSTTAVSDMLLEAWTNCVKATVSSGELDTVHIVTLKEISQLELAQKREIVVDWTADSSVPIMIEQVDAKISFKPDKTYLLFGLSGQLGRSIAQWMVYRGARYIVLTSRNPDVDSRWVEMLEALGATIQIYPNDITDKIAVQKLCEHVRSTFPPIAGVANGAMVLQDTSINDMTIEIMNKVRRPKVDGSKHLDEIFSADTLDFFILFSSLASIFGNHGQSNYTSANLFLTSLAAQRRKRGLAASVIAIGAVMGIGYMAREVSQVALDQIQKAGYLWLSERDFHQIFAEGVFASRSDSGPNPEIITGLRVVKADEEVPMQWFTNPIFQHCVLQSEGSDANKGDGNVIQPVKTQLLTAKTQKEVYQVLKDTFTLKLQIILQLEQAPSLELGADELGIDSLVAVEVRSWFLRETLVDMPVLKILGGASVGNMLDYALEKLPRDLTPNLADDSTPQAIPENPSAGLSQPQSIQLTSSDTFESSFTQTGDSSPDESGVLTMSSSYEIEEPSTPKSVIQRSEPMSFGQSRFWFLRSYIGDQTTFNISCSIHLNGNLRPDDLEKAVQVVAHRHEALRTSFFADENQRPMQGILNIPVLHLERKSTADIKEIAKEFARIKTHIYDLDKGETMRIVLISQSATSHFLMVGYHHINMDGISLQVLLSDIDKSYRRQSLSPKMLQYPEFSSRQRKDFQIGGMKTELAYWRKEFPDFPTALPLLPFSLVTSRQIVTRYDSSKVDIKVSSGLAARIRDTCRKHKITPFHFYLVAFKTLLFRFLDIDDLCIGIADANRTETDALQSIGIYLNLLPLRFRIHPGQTFANAVKEAQSKVRSALTNSRLPFDVLLEELDPPRSATHSPLFQAFVDYRPPVPQERSFAGCKMLDEEYEIGRTAYDITLEIVDTVAGDAAISFMLQKDLYSRGDAEILMKSYTALLAEFSENATIRLDQLSLFSPAEVEKAIKLGQGSVAPLEWPKTLSHRIDDMVVRHGTWPALADGAGNNLTYQQMGRRVNAIAAALLAAEVVRESRVAVFQEPTNDWVCSLLAILRVGAVYVPLDPTQLPRLAAIVNDCQPTAIVVHSATLGDLPALKSQKARFIDVTSLVEFSMSALHNEARAESPAVILYTSGSTGVPKGVLLKHSSLRHEVEGAAKKYDYGVPKILQQSAFSFDWSISQIFMALATGGSLYIVPRSERGDPAALAKLIVSQNITMTGTTPSEYISWFHYGDTDLLQKSQWRTAISGGELFADTLKRGFRDLGKQDLRVFNTYGPTEVTHSSHKIEVYYVDDGDSRTSASDRVPAGFTGDNCSMYIVDKHLKAVPVGIPGEIVIGGSGVAMGYLNNQDLTRKQFLPDVYATAEFISKGWKTMYRTGDKGKLRADGALMFETRIAGDTQVKLRGLRIELQDIEKNIVESANGALVDAVVSLRGDPQFLIAHVVFSKHHGITDSEKYLKQLSASLPLPQYMRPAVVISLEKMPVTKHYKTDRAAINALPLPRSTKSEQENSQLTEVESKMKDIWEQVISKNVVDLHTIEAETDFFHVGGNSLLLVRLQAQIKQTFGVLLPLVQLFETSTLWGMASRIDGKDPQVLATIDWESESDISPNLRPVLRSPGLTAPASRPKVVILTGSTGFLGKVLLRHLVEVPSIEKIYCIAVRATVDRPLSTNTLKISYHAGDLILPRLGLSEADACKIFASADAIIHNGADVSFLKTFHSLARANLDSTKTLVHLCLPRQIPFHFISTAGVAHLSFLDEFAEGSASAYPPPTDGMNGYVASKWASERYLEKIVAAEKLPVWIHRPSTVTGEDAPELDVMHNVLTYSRAMKAVPTSDKWRGFLDFIDVEVVAHGIVSQLTTNDIAAAKKVKYVHQSGGFVLPVLELKEYLQKESGVGFETLGLKAWAERARERGMNGLVATFLGMTLAEREEVAVFPKLLKGK